MSEKHPPAVRVSDGWLNHVGDGVYHDHDGKAYRIQPRRDMTGFEAVALSQGDAESAALSKIEADTRRWAEARTPTPTERN